ncbi:MAG: hypothetical protein ABR910_15430 [Acidobacteriaceae bacterium]|jgi:hypothetical protein
MKQGRVLVSLAVLLAAIAWGQVAEGQNPTAIQRLQLSAFGAVSGVFTGLGGGKNFSVTAGADLALPPFHGVRPTLEARGTYPTDRGLVDNQKSAMGGLRVDFLLGHRWHPYGDFLFGRGEMLYTPYGYMFNNNFYELTTTNVYSAGAGFDYDLGEHLAVKVDAQFQRWASTSVPTPSGAIWSKVGTAGIVYRFDFNRHNLR